MVIQCQVHWFGDPKCEGLLLRHRMLVRGGWEDWPGLWCWCHAAIRKLLQWLATAYCFLLQHQLLPWLAAWISLDQLLRAWGWQRCSDLWWAASPEAWQSHSKPCLSKIVAASKDSSKLTKRCEVCATSTGRLAQRWIVKLSTSRPNVVIESGAWQHSGTVSTLCVCWCGFQLPSSRNGTRTWTTGAPLSLQMPMQSHLSSCSSTNRWHFWRWDGLGMARLGCSIPIHWNFLVHTRMHYLPEGTVAQPALRIKGLNKRNQESA